MSNEIERLEITIEQAREEVAKRDRMERLLENADFKELFTDGYLLHEASRLVLLKGDPRVDAEMQAQIDKDIIAIGCFRQYIATIITTGNMAERAIKNDEQTLQELHEEELAGN